MNASEIEKEMKSENPIVIDFSAEWCGSCKAVSRVINELSEEYKDIKFLKVDIAKDASYTQKYNITSLPTILFIKQGKEIARRNGNTSKFEFKQMIQQML